MWPAYVSRLWKCPRCPRYNWVEDRFCNSCGLHRYATNEKSPASSPNTQQEVVPSEACAAASEWYLLGPSVPRPFVKVLVFNGDFVGFMARLPHIVGLPRTFQDSHGNEFTNITHWAYVNKPTESSASTPAPTTPCSASTGDLVDQSLVTIPESVSVTSPEFLASEQAQNNYQSWEAVAPKRKNRRAPTTPCLEEGTQEDKS
jgi:hypothetical protein